MGYSAERGDTLSVVNSVFTDDTPASPPIWENPIYLDYALQLAKYLLIALMVVLVWRKLVKPLMETAALAKEQADAQEAQLASSREQIAAEERRASEISRYEDNMNTARTMAEKDPRAVAMVLRSWMEKKDGNR